MKHIVFLIFILVFLMTTLVACYTTIPDEDIKEDSSMFVIVEEAPSWLIVYHKTTRVMYAVSDGSYTYGNFTLLVDADGSPLLWDGRSEE